MLESTLEHIADDDTGRLVYTIMAGVNAHRSRADGKKAKAGLERKFIDGGTIGPARPGYLNVRIDVEGRKVASITLDPERSDYITTAFDLCATGEHTITTITDILEDAGLRTRATLKRPSKPLSRSMIHRILRDDYYVGIVTLNGAKRPGRHPALIDHATFDQAQKILDGHRASGDRSHKHHHYLKGTLFCACGKRLGFGRHRGRHGGIYEYFSCLSRLQRGGRCEAPYFQVERTERAIVRRYKRETLKSDVQAIVRQSVREYVEAKTEIGRRESERHNRRLRELTDQQQKLVQLYYKDSISEEVLKAEQERIENERQTAQRWADAAEREVEDIMAALDDALILLDDNHIIYEAEPNHVRRLINQAIFLALTVHDPDTIEAQRTPLYDEIARLADDLQEAKKAPEKAAKRPRTAKNKALQPQKDPDPLSRGRGSYIVQMAGGQGLEPRFSGPKPDVLPLDDPPGWGEHMLPRGPVGTGYVAITRRSPASATIPDAPRGEECITGWRRALGDTCTCVHEVVRPLHGVVSSF